MLPHCYLLGEPHFPSKPLEILDIVGNDGAGRHPAPCRKFILRFARLAFGVFDDAFLRRQADQKHGFRPTVSLAVGADMGDADQLLGDCVWLHSVVQVLSDSILGLPFGNSKVPDPPTDATDHSIFLEKKSSVPAFFFLTTDWRRFRNRG